MVAMVKGVRLLVRSSRVQFLENLCCTKGIELFGLSTTGETSRGNTSWRDPDRSLCNKVEGIVTSSS